MSSFFFHGSIKLLLVGLASSACSALLLGAHMTGMQTLVLQSLHIGSWPFLSFTCTLSATDRSQLQHLPR